MPDSGDVTSASGGGVDSDGDPVAVEMREVLVCVVEQLEGVVKRQTSSDGDSSEGKCIFFSYYYVSLPPILSPFLLPSLLFFLLLLSLPPSLSLP